ncbi:MAG: glutamine amidotransferase [Cyanobacteria bacterium RYN_339]|nr:glutamine amidotransferase [Cyanobacteria bacterium RYN_339]
MVKHGKTVGFLVADETDTAEYEPIVDALRAAGTTCVIVAPDRTSLERICLAGSCPVRVGFGLQTARSIALDALVVPDGRGVDAFLHQDKALDFLRALDQQGVPIVTLGRGALVLVAADLVDGRHLAVPDELARDLEPMGGIVSLAGYLKEGTRISAHGGAQIGLVAEALAGVLEGVAGGTTVVKF